MFFKTQAINEKGILLVGVVAIMVMAGLFTTAIVSMQVNNVVQVDQSLYALSAKATAQGVENWYMRQLANDSNWTNESTQSLTLGDVAVTININSASAKEVDFLVSATVTPEEGLFDMTRSMRTVAERSSPVFNYFAVYNDYAGARLRLQANTQPTVVTGNIYSEGGGDVDSGNTQTGGVFYIPNGATFSSDFGTKREKTLATGIGPEFPVINATTYTDTMDAYDTQLASLSGTSNLTVNNSDFVIEAANSRCTNDATYGVVCDFTQFLTRGATVNITGNGTIRCSNQCRLHYRSGESEGSVLNITPDDGGHITFLSVTNMHIGHANGRSDISINTSSTSATRTVNFYAQALDSTNRLLYVRGNGTEINNGANANTQVNFYSRRWIQFNDGAQAHGKNNLVFVHDSATFGPLNSSTNNLFQMTGDSAASVGRPTLFEGVAIVYESSYATDAVRFSGGYSSGANVQFNGLLYQYDGASLGACDIDDADIRGAVICSRFQGNSIRRSNITYDADVLPISPLVGFEGYIARKRNSQDGI